MPNDGWAAAGVDEFLRSYLTPSGRYAFYESARRIYMDEPHGEDGFWTRLAGMAPETMFVWGKQDQLVPISFMQPRRGGASRRASIWSSTAGTSPRSKRRARPTGRWRSSSRG